MGCLLLSRRTQVACLLGSCLLLSGTQTWPADGMPHLCASFSNRRRGEGDTPGLVGNCISSRAAQLFQLINRRQAKMEGEKGENQQQPHQRFNIVFSRPRRGVLLQSESPDSGTVTPPTHGVSCLSSSRGWTRWVLNSGTSIGPALNHLPGIA